jgi:hypothetical protein
VLTRPNCTASTRGTPTRPEDQPNAAPSWNTFELLMLSTESSSCGSTPKETARVMTSRGARRSLAGG